MSTRRFIATAATAGALLAFLPASRAAHAQQALALNVGHFAVRGVDARAGGDVLLENLGRYAFELADLDDVAVGGEWLTGFGEYFETGVGLGFFRGAAPSVHADYVPEDGGEFRQEFRLRIVPVTATLRLFPFGRGAAVEPYVGGGVGVFNWRYSEVGEFLDYDLIAFQGRYVADGVDVGGVVVGGVRVPVGSGFAAGVELQYQHAAGRVGGDDEFLADRIDLGGLSTRFTFRIGF